MARLDVSLATPVKSIEKFAESIRTMPDSHLGNLQRSLSDRPHHSAASLGQVVERLIFMAQVTKTGEVFTDRDEKGSPVVLHRVRKFPIKAGRSEVSNGNVIFPDTQRRPQLPTRSVRPLLEFN